MRTVFVMVIAAASFSVPARPVEASPDRFSGNWLFAQRLTSEVSVPVLGAIRSDTWVVGSVEVTQSGNRLSGTGPICDMWVDGPPLVRTELTSAFRRAVSPIRIDAVVDGSRLVQSRMWTVHGANLRDLRRSPLPRTPDDARVVDADSDGAPGLTILIRGIVRGEVHVIQRAWASWTATLDSKGWFSGPVRFEQEQRILSATSRRLEKPLEVTPSPAHSRIWLIPQSKPATCATIRSRAASLIDGAAR